MKRRSFLKGILGGAAAAGTVRPGIPTVASAEVPTVLTDDLVVDQLVHSVECQWRIVDFTATATNSFTYFQPEEDG